MMPIATPREPIRLVLADIDGTLITPDHVLTPRAQAAVEKVVAAGIAFTIVSGRPPRGMKSLIDALHLVQPVTAFNGGVVVRPDLSIIQENLLSRAAVQPALDTIVRHHLDAWIYNDKDWFVLSDQGSHIEREKRTIGFSPTVLPDFDGVMDGVAKLVGVSDDFAAVVRCQDEVRQLCGECVSASRSQPYYLDITHPKANKGDALSALSEMLHIPTANIAVIGDMPSDVFMFERAGTSIAMGNASPEVQQAATFVTTPNTEDGFALAMERLVLGEKDS